VHVRYVKPIYRISSTLAPTTKISETTPATLLRASTVSIAEASPALFDMTGLLYAQAKLGAQCLLGRCIGMVAGTR